MPSSSPRGTPSRVLLGPPPACLNRYSSATPAPSSTVDVDNLRNQAFQKLQDTWDDIIERYTNVDQDLEDEVDLFTGEVVVDRGRIKAMDSWEFGGDDDDEGETGLETPTVSLGSAPSGSSDDEDELAGWGEASGLDWQVVDPDLLARIQRAAEAQKQWTDADKDDLESFMELERRRAALETNGAEPQSEQTPTITPARVFRRTIYSEKPEGFFPSSMIDSESEDEIGVYRASSQAPVLVTSRSMPEMVGIFTTKSDGQGLPIRRGGQNLSAQSSPSTSRTAVKRSQSSGVGLSAKARGKLPAGTTAAGASYSIRRHSIHATDRRVADGRESDTADAAASTRSPATVKNTPATPAISRSTTCFTSGSLARRLRKLSVRFSPVVLNYPPYHSMRNVDATDGPLLTDARCRTAIRQHTPHHSTVQRANSTASTDPFAPDYHAWTEPSKCAECVRAGGARALGAATCSGSNEGVECELAAAGRAAEQNRLALALAHARQQEEAELQLQEVSPAPCRGVRKRPRVILSPDASEDEQAAQPAIRSLPSTPLHAVANRGTTKGLNGAQSEPRKRSSSRPAYGHPLITAATAHIRLRSPPRVDSDDSDDELALTDDPRTQVDMAPPREVAAYIRRQSLRPRSPSVSRSAPVIGLPTPPPSRASCRSTRTPLPMLPPPPPNLKPFCDSSTPSKRQRRSTTVSSGTPILQQLSTPAPSKSPTPHRQRQGLIRSRSGPVV